jgi:rare lipoprotein A
MASWYGPGFHGKLTAKGDRYDMNEMTAAHRTLPLGSVARVRSLTTGRTVTVRINDRGPFAKNRILDVSFAAAQSLGMIGPGTDEVDLRVIDYRGHPGAVGLLYVQVGSFAEPDNARTLAARLRRRYPEVRVQAVEVWTARRFRVQVGRYRSEQEAEAAASRIGAEVELDTLILRDDS